MGRTRRRKATRQSGCNLPLVLQHRTRLCCVSYVGKPLRRFTFRAWVPRKLATWFAVCRDVILETAGPGSGVSVHVTSPEEIPLKTASRSLLAIAVSCASLGLVASARAAEPATAITIYNSTQPGAISR